MNRNIKIEIIVIVILLFTLVFGGNIFLKKNEEFAKNEVAENVADKIINKNVQPNIDNKPAVEYGADKIYWPKNFGLSIISDWQDVSSDKLTLPKDMDGVQFAYRKKNTDCVFAYLRTNDFKDLYKQTSFATRIFTTENEQLDASWYLYKKDLPEDFEFNRKGRQTMSGEVRINYYPVFFNDADSSFKNVFILFNVKGGIVPEYCDEDVSLMLGSIYSKFEDIKINNDSNGILYINSVHNKPTYLRFIPEKDNVAKNVSEVDMNYVPNPTVFKGILYFVSEDGNLKSMDIISGEARDVLDKIASEENVINEYYFYDDRIFYLFGKNCNFYLSQCDLSLYEYNIKSRRSKFLIKNLFYRNILGYDKEKDVLYMKRVDGDAGGFAAKIGGYDFSKNKIVGQAEYSGEINDKKSGYEKFRKFEKSFEKQSFSYDFMLIEDGKIIEPKSQIKTPGGWWNIRYMK